MFVIAETLWAAGIILSVLLESSATTGGRSILVPIGVSGLLVLAGVASFTIGIICKMHG